MSNERDNDIIELEFTNKIDAGDASVYGKLPKGINWIMDENMDVIGITFKRIIGELFRDDINNILWYFGEFDNDSDDE